MRVTRAAVNNARQSDASLIRIGPLLPVLVLLMSACPCTSFGASAEPAAAGATPAAAASASSSQGSAKKNATHVSGAAHAAAGKSGSATAAVAPAPMRNLPNRFAGRAGIYYRIVWGVDDLVVKQAESGEIVRFSWRVLDPQLAQVLSDNKAQPSLIDPQAGVSLVIPAMENIGQLRQTAPPEAGKSYWMAFSNSGRFVKKGDRVDVVVGTFKAQGLVVD